MPGAPRKTRGPQKPDRAKEAAGKLIAAASAGPEAVRACAEETARELGAPVRVKVLVAMADAMPPSGLSAEAIDHIVAELGGSAKTVSQPAFAHAAFRLALAAGSGNGVAWVVDALRQPEGGTCRFRFPVEVIAHVARTSPGAGDLFVGALREITAGEFCGPALERWMTVLLEALAPVPGSPDTPFEPVDAGTCLGLLGVLPPEKLPGMAFFVLARLTVLAPADAARAFSATPAGGAIARFIPTHRAVQTQPASSTGDRADQIVSEVRSGFERLAGEIAALPLTTTQTGSGLEVEALRREAVSLRDEAARVAAERDDERARLAGLSDELDGARTERDAALGRTRLLEDRLAAAEEAAAKWQTESQRREGELTGQFQTREGRTREEHRRLLAPSARELCDHIRELLERNPGIEPIRRMAVSFDGLQRRIIQLIGEGDLPRLPRNMLAPPDAGAGSDGRHD